jgi:hypothetical protein
MRVWSLLAVAALAGCSSSLERDLADAQAATPSSAWNEVPLEAGTFLEHGVRYRSDTIDIPVAAFGELEYKLGIREGDAIVYRWDTADMPNPELLYSEFHGHTERVGNAPGTLMFYRKASGGTESGTLVAPFSGIHGWYLKSTYDRPIVVRLNVAGFYELIGQ